MAIEVVSPRDLAWEVDEKVDEYLRAGIRLVWVVFPDTKTIHVYRSDQEMRRLTESDQLTGEDVLPGFSYDVSELFPESRADIS